jgi:hypothetical protein
MNEFYQCLEISNLDWTYVDKLLCYHSEKVFKGTFYARLHYLKLLPSNIIFYNKSMAPPLSEWKRKVPQLIYQLGWFDCTWSQWKSRITTVFFWFLIIKHTYWILNIKWSLNVPYLGFMEGACSHYVFVLYLSSLGFIFLLYYIKCYNCSTIINLGIPKCLFNVLIIY